MFFEIWDTASGNIVGTWDTEEETLAVLRRSLEEHGSAYIEALYLGQGNARGGGKAIAEGKALVELVRSSKPPAARQARSTHRSR